MLVEWHYIFFTTEKYIPYFSKIFVFQSLPSVTFAVKLVLEYDLPPGSVSAFIHISYPRHLLQLRLKQQFISTSLSKTYLWLLHICSFKCDMSTWIQTYMHLKLGWDLHILFKMEHKEKLKNLKLSLFFIS